MHHLRRAGGEVTVFNQPEILEFPQLELPMKADSAHPGDQDAVQLHRAWIC